MNNENNQSGNNGSRRWKHILDLSDIFNGFKEKRLTPFYAGVAVADRIKESSVSFDFANDEDLQKIIQEFDEIANVDEFDMVLERFYNWADESNRCWIKTF